MEKIVRPLLLLLTCLCSLSLAAEYRLTLSHNSYEYPETFALSYSSKTFIVRGRELKSDLIVASTNPRFHLSTTTIAPSDIDPDDGFLLTVEFRPLVLGEQKAELTITDPVEGKSVKCSLWGIAKAFQPSFAVKGAPTPFQTVLYSPSASQSITIEGKYLSTNLFINITPPAGFEVSTDDLNYSPTLSLEASTLNDVTQTLYVRLNAPFVSNFEGNLKIEISDFSCPSVVIPLKGKIGKSTPILKENPIVSQNLTLGDPLGNAELLGGLVVNSQGKPLSGTFHWIMGDDYDQLPVGLHELKIYFQPDYGYGYETIETSVSMRILPARQEIIWMQDLSQPLHPGQEVQLTASTSSGLPIRYHSDNNELADINDSGLLTARQIGRLRICAFQDGNADFQEAWGIAYFIEIKEPDNGRQSTIQAFWDRSTQSLHVSTAERSVVRLFDTYGSLLMVRQVMGEANLYLPHNQNGIIIINIQNNSDTYQQKIYLNHDF